MNKANQSTRKTSVTIANKIALHCLLSGNGSFFHGFGHVAVLLAFWVGARKDVAVNFVEVWHWPHLKGQRNAKGWCHDAIRFDSGTQKFSECTSTNLGADSGKQTSSRLWYKARTWSFFLKSREAFSSLQVIASWHTSHSNETSAQVFQPKSLSLLTSNLAPSRSSMTTSPVAPKPRYTNFMPKISS